mmetsp:Transcript_47422/g.122679  ORF Transcript_47422/g.122679 Transcript_47422/m.122679 type:complete len:478 (+) Transcript_47422:239-1672(+)
MNEDDTESQESASPANLNSKRSQSVRWTFETDFLLVKASICLVEESLTLGLGSDLDRPIGTVADMVRSLVAEFTEGIIRNRVKRPVFGFQLTSLFERVPGRQKFRVNASLFTQMKQDLQKLLLQSSERSLVVSGAEVRVDVDPFFRRYARDSLINSKASKSGRRGRLPAKRKAEEAEREEERKREEAARLRIAATSAAQERARGERAHSNQASAFGSPGEDTPRRPFNSREEEIISQEESPMSASPSARYNPSVQQPPAQQIPAYSGVANTTFAAQQLQLQEMQQQMYRLQAQMQALPVGAMHVPGLVRQSFSTLDQFVPPQQDSIYPYPSGQAASNPSLRANINAILESDGGLGIAPGGSYMGGNPNYPSQAGGAISARNYEGQRVPSQWGARGDQSNQSFVQGQDAMSVFAAQQQDRFLRPTVPGMQQRMAPPARPIQAFGGGGGVASQASSHGVRASALGRASDFILSPRKPGY